MWCSMKDQRKCLLNVILKPFIMMEMQYVAITHEKGELKMGDFLELCPPH